MFDIKYSAYIYNQFTKKGIEHIIKVHEPLIKYTSLKIGGPADFFCIPENIKQLKDVISISTKNNIPYWVIGSGTNLLVLDKGVRGVVIKLGKCFKKIYFFDRILKVGAGVNLSHLSKMAIKKSLSGMEFAYNIPGTLGGAIINNSGFKESCVSDVIDNITMLTKENGIKIIPRSSLHFNYRKCSLKGKSGIILEASLLLKKGNKDKMKLEVKENNKIRKDRQPLDKYNAGSVFKNPPGYSAGFLVEKVGAKGLSHGEAEVSKKHANFIINNGNASANDILYLIEELEKRVKNIFGIELEREIEILGER